MKRQKIRDVLGFAIILILVSMAVGPAVAQSDFLSWSDDRLVVAFSGIFIGVLLRTVLPYNQKKNENGGSLAFDGKYLASAIASILASFVAAAMLIQLFVIPTGIISSLGLFLLAVAFGYSANDKINDIFIDLWS